LERWDNVAKHAERLADTPLRTPLRAGEDYELELRVVGQTLTVSVNGKVLATVTDASVKEGQFGVGTFENNRPSTLVKSLEVLDLDAPGGGAAGGSQASRLTQTPSGGTPDFLAATKSAPFVNSLGMKFVPVPITGGPTDQQRVLFSIWETRVQDYEVFAPETKRAWSKPSFEQTATHPAVKVTWDDANAFCVWLTERERRVGKIGPNERYRLPSDHEWSCAVGIGDREDASKSPAEKNGKILDVFPWGGTWPPPAKVGNYSGEEAAGHEVRSGQHIMSGYRDDFPATAPAGSFPANSLGLYDLSGNAGELCKDLYQPGKTEHAFRAPAFSDEGRSFLSSSRRWGTQPLNPREDIGFRVVLAPAP
jgi:hypothetical protein